MAGEGYFVSPTDELIEVRTFHINEILSHPEKFGFSNAEIDSLYEKYHEGRGHEGKARSEIMARVLQRGWVRIRHYSRQDMFSIEVNKYDSKAKDHIQAFADKMITEKKASKNAEARITALNIPLSTEFDEQGEPKNTSPQSVGTFSLKQLQQYAHYDKAAKNTVKLKRIQMSDYQPTKQERIAYIISNIRYVIKPTLKNLKGRLDKS